MKIVENETFDMERALYASQGVLVKHCTFDGCLLYTSDAADEL